MALRVIPQQQQTLRLPHFSQTQPSWQSFKDQVEPRQYPRALLGPTYDSSLGCFDGCGYVFSPIRGAFGGAPGAEGAAAPKEAEEDVPMPDVPRTGARGRGGYCKRRRQSLRPMRKRDLVPNSTRRRTSTRGDCTLHQKLGKSSRISPTLTTLVLRTFEKGEYEEAIKACEKAVEEGREIYADFKMIAKSYARIGTSYEKLGDLPKAIENYNKSLTEHRTPEVVNKLRAAEKNKIDSAKKAYIDPVKAEEARELGNQKFKESDWPGAVEAYSEMIKRAPEDPRGYSNRAASFIKLLEFPSALEDCDKAISKDSKFVRAYIRKAQAYFGMRDYSKSLDACNEASEADVTKANAREIEQQQQKATKERLSRDPEIQRIMGDPVMQSILQQAQNDPAALQEHMKNPQIRSKIQQLIAAGFAFVAPTGLIINHYISSSGWLNSDCLGHGCEIMMIYDQ
ncbi:hypothetical protein EYC84_004905 [Monilinia fructicola]|uniref:STI1 domain-containing protein n=1 Tax=Monilinia fructicola TaxID=38448 RepID=A0A5M9K5C5_MONFR|nr:hypothetical protein EYC84_004905 [Monilinia fructicola]